MTVSATVALEYNHDGAPLILRLSVLEPDSLHLMAQIAQAIEASVTGTIHLTMVRHSDGTAFVTAEPVK